MKIGVISDTHIPLKAKGIPVEVLNGLKGVDLILHAGDLIDVSVLEQLRKIAEVKAVVGNMDNPEVVRTLSKKEVVKVNNFKIGLIHGFGPPNGIEERIRGEFEGNIDVIVFGHSHSAVNETRNGVLFFNPGSPTDKFFAPFNSYGIIEINDKIEAKIIKF